MATTFVLTTMPHPELPSAVSSFSLSVAINPQIRGENHLPPLLVDWPATLHASVFTVQLRSTEGVVREFGFDQIKRHIRADSSLWAATLARMPLDAHRLQLATERLHSFDASGLEKNVRSAFERRKTTPQPQPQADQWFEPDDNFRAFQVFHGLVRPPGVLADPPVSLQPRPMGFHQAIAALSSYPAVLEKLGLVFQIELPLLMREAYADPALRAGEARVVLAGPQPSFSPWTKYLIERTESEGSVMYLALPAPRPGSAEVGLGLANLGDPELYECTTVDVDGAGLGVHAKLSTEDPRPALPPLRSAGIGLIIKRRLERERAAANRARELQEMMARLELGEAVEPPVLHAEDLVRGYRVDVAPLNDAGHGTWRSVCWRRGTYAPSIGGGPRFEAYDEGAVVSGLTETAPTGSLLLAHEVLFRWEGWSLAVPRPGKRIGSDGKLVHETQLAPSGTVVECRLASSDRPEHKLPRLRFGKSYKLRARAVDAAGVGLSVGHADRVVRTHARAVVQRKYLRTDAVPAPTLLAGAPLDPNEHADRLIIRTRASALGPSVRHVLPPPITLALAEKHGVLDGFETADEAYHRLIAVDEKRRRLVPDENRDLVVAAGAFSDGLLHYLPDPAARGVMVRFHLPNREFKDTYQFDWNFGWPACRPFILELTDGASGASWNGNQRRLTVKIPAGTSGKLHIRSYCEPAALGDHFDPLGLERDPTTGKLIGEFTPEETIELIHALQKPIAPLFDSAPDVLRARREEGSQWAFFEQWVTVGAGTGALRALADWQDPNDQGEAFTFDRSSVELGQIMHDSEAGGTRARLALKHSFADTRRHDLAVTLHADSRFKDLFPGEPTTAESTPQQIIVQSSARPPSLELDAVVPVLEWSEQTTPNGVVRTRKCEAIRVFVRKPWFVSGPDERIGVAFATNTIPVVAPEDPNADIAALGGTGPYITQWAADPLWASAWVNGRWSGRPSLRGPERRDFRTTLIADGVRLMLPASEPGGEPQWLNERVDIATYPVEPRGNWDAERRAWFADVRFVPTSEICAGYFPFVRLALVRYQPESVGELHASPVTIAPPVQLLPQRTLTVRQVILGETQEIQLQLSGIAPLWPEGQALGSAVALIEEKPSPNDAWAVLDGTTQQLEAPREPGRAELTWAGVIRVRANPARPRRLVVREYDHGEADRADRLRALPPVSAAAQPEPGPTRRLIFGDIVPLRG